MVNREFLDWLSGRQQPNRPFFVFLNYYDTHYPYELPATGIHRFGEVPRNDRETAVLRDWNESKKVGLPGGRSPSLATLTTIAWPIFDEQLGICSTSSSAGLSSSGPGSLSRPITARVSVNTPASSSTERPLPDGEPCPPCGHPSGRSRVTLGRYEPVSLRDLAATIVDVAG